MSGVKHYHVTYNAIHETIQNTVSKIAEEFDPDILVAIGDGFFPARVMRTFLRQNTPKTAIQIQAIGLSLYEPLEGSSQELVGVEVVRTQWLTDSGKVLAGKHILVVDEVDDTRKTLSYALAELRKDVEEEIMLRPQAERDELRKKTTYGIFVVHNKLKPKLADLPQGVAYYAGANIPDVWLDYPWETIDIREHDLLALEDAKIPLF
ncbi:PRTase-like protein [Fistulina hepatica ATCC 64428]|uniref:PRTase-like protein n=1 Tax=Fistulina hepatica ATCC 64428 TaxID=1128425 RepID=A0A0D7AMQ2_9AGAR|nr:PRTase-like protein [Fistulina hepatica ATCC 64428]